VTTSSSVMPEIFYQASTEEDVFPSSVAFVSYYVFFSFSLFPGDYKGATPFIVMNHLGITPPPSFPKSLIGNPKAFKYLWTPA